MEPNEFPRRATAAALVVGAGALLALLTNHPHPSGTTFLELMRSEAEQARIDAVIHGGFIAVLCLLLTSLSLVARALYRTSPMLASGGLVFFAAGCIAFSAAMLLDGFMVPRLAGDYVNSQSPSRAELLQVEINFCHTLIGLLMAMAMLFHALTMAMWSFVWIHLRGITRLIGLLGVTAGLCIIAGIAMAEGTLGTTMAVASFLLNAAWYIGVAVYAMHGAAAWRPAPDK
jgi:hypothetical protein